MLYELEDASHLLQTVHRELDLCTEVMDESLGEIKQQGLLFFSERLTQMFFFFFFHFK